mmetsp:Transcript_12372/g.41033  ORF Transcript_12372/g.41033 Transcript_12372/m.41033 type:complete len:367 (+) Transcript_12372:49-1149(+)
MPLPSRKKLHLGKTPMKFYFRAQDISVNLDGIDVEGSLVLVWKRGTRRTASEPFPIVEELSAVDGSLSRTAATTQDMAQICTMFKSSKGAFEPKLSKVSLVVEPPAGGAGRGGKAEQGKKLGSTTLDLGAYASVDMTSHPVELSFLDGKASVTMTLASHWLKNLAAGGPSDDGSSVASFCTDADSDAGSEASERSELEERSAPARSNSIKSAVRAAGAFGGMRRSRANTSAAAASGLEERSAPPGCSGLGGGGGESVGRRQRVVVCAAPELAAAIGLVHPKVGALQGEGEGAEGERREDERPPPDAVDEQHADDAADELPARDRRREPDDERALLLADRARVECLPQDRRRVVHDRVDPDQLLQRL